MSLHEPAEPDLLRVAKLVLHDPLERVQHTLGLGLGQLCSIGDGGKQLRLGQRHGNTSSNPDSTIIARIQLLTADDRTAGGVCPDRRGTLVARIPGPTVAVRTQCCF